MTLTDLHIRRRGRAVVAILALTGACASPPGPARRVVIPRGASLRTAADSLASRGVVRSAFAFRAYARVTGRARPVKAGTYVLRPGTGWPELLDDLARGRGIVSTVTIPEGYSLVQIVPLLARALSVPDDSVQAAVRDTTLRRELDLPAPTVEGYLFPSTYTFVPGTTARQAVAEMVHLFERSWRPAWGARLQALAMNRNDVVTLASIIEKEARLPEERPVISAVYHNRLKAGMLLQADPTVQYALGHHVGRVLYRDLEVDSPYNTYRHKGLPPGPIGSPGLPSIEAALYPASVPYLFFVASTDGHHEFSTTFSEHTQNIRDLRRARTAQDSGGGSSAAGGDRQRLR